MATYTGVQFFRGHGVYDNILLIGQKHILPYQSCLW